jgi:uncharacterized protein (TIGR03663 family)
MNRPAAFVVFIFAACGAGLALRLPHLDLRPVHVDEAVHADKYNTLWTTGRYEYDPTEYHGPTLYYFTLPAVWLSGAPDFAHTDAATFRMVAVVFGAGLILLLLLVADGLGRPATACAAFLAAISPALVYYSRYYIQEMLLVFFTFLVIAAGWRYVQTRHWSWAILAGVGVGLMHATKETCVIALGCMAAALALTVLWQRNASGDVRRWALVGGVTAAVVVSVVFFSGFFTNAKGPWDSVRALTTYLGRAGGGGVHEHPWYYYLHILTYWRGGGGPVWSEGLTIGLGLVGIAAAVKGRGLARFLAIYALLMAVVYSAVPYKTPWCMLSVLHALTLLGGIGAVTLVRTPRHRLAQAAVAGLLLIAGAQLAWQANRASSERYCANERNPYVYAHTLYSAADLAAQLESLTRVTFDGHHLLIKVMVENCWPLPWYLRGFDRVGYWETVPDRPDADVILASSTLQSELEPRLKAIYQVNTRGLRRDERLLVYIRQDLWDAFTEHLLRAPPAPS